MSEPVVIIGPAPMSAKRSEAPAENGAGDGDPGAQSQRRPGSKGKASMLSRTLAHRAKGLWGVIARGPVTFAKMGMAMGRRYPRHSLAAAASIVILGAIWYTQGSRHPVTTEITGERSADVAKDPKPATGPKTDVPAASGDQAAITSTEKTGAANPGATVTARSDAAPPADKPSPAAAAGDAGAALAAAPPAGKEPEPAPAMAPPAELTAAAKPDQAPAPAPALSPSQSTPTLLPSMSPDPASPPVSAVVTNEKPGGDADQPAPAADAPAPVGALPAPASDALVLANQLEPAGDPTRSAQPPALSPGSPTSGTPEPTATGETKTPGITPPIASQLDPAPLPNLAAPSKELAKIDSVQPEPPKSETPKVEEPAPGAPGLAPRPEATAPPSVLPDLPVPGAEPAAVAALVGSKSPVPDSKSPASASTEMKNRGPDAARHPAETEPRSSSVKQDEPAAKSRASQHLADDGWVSVPNSGKVPTDDDSPAGAQGGDVGTAGGDGPAMGRDDRAHTAKDMGFEIVSPRARTTPDAERTGQSAATAGAAALGSKSAAGRVDSVPHVVEKLENFWTISRRYYGNGRYYRALWKANVDNYPKITDLRVNDVIVVPPVEDLDPAFIEAPRARAQAPGAVARNSGGRSRAGGEDSAAGLTESLAATGAVTGDGAYSTARTSRRSAEGVPVRRSSRTDPDLELPQAGSIARRSPAPDRAGHRADRSFGDDEASDDEPDTRTAARPRAAVAASRRHPVHKVRPYESLRSIARDRLGDSRRADEILNLNTDLIDDPAHLIVGQIIQLPDDARTGVRR